MSPISTSVERLDGNKVRLHVAVPADEFETAIDAAFRKLAQEVKVPGFRPGKAPRQLLEARFGAEAAREQALRDALPDYYREALISEDLDTIAAPDIDITSGEDDGDVEFDAVVELRPVVELEGYRGLRVEIPSPAVTDEALATQVDALRGRFADLEETKAPLSDGLYATIDITGSRHGEPIDDLTATDYLYEVGSEGLVAALDEQLRGKGIGDILQFNAVLPERFGERAGEEVTFRVLVKDAKRKVLPEATDEWASEVSEFETLAELEDDIRARLDLMSRLQAQMLVRDKVLDAAAQLVDIELPDALVENETSGRLQDLDHRLRHQGATLGQYVAATGQDPEAFVAAVREGATGAVRADLALRAVVAQEGIVATDEELDAEIERLAERLEQKPQRVRRDLERNGGIEAVRSDLVRSKALRFLVDHAEVVDEEGTIVDLSVPPGEGVAPDETETDSERESQEPEA